jgi:CHAD domain-containing protein
MPKNPDVPTPPKSKWIEGTCASMPLAEAAQKILSVRLETVWYYLQLAARGNEDTIEHVHQLRVATRRADASLRTFRPLLPRSRAKWISRQLKRLRRAAGDARDLDVLKQRLITEYRDQQGRKVSGLLKHVEQLRDKAQPPIHRAFRRLKRRGFKQRARQMIRRVRIREEAIDPQETNFGWAAIHGVAESTDRFFRAAQADFSDIAKLHQFRIESKRLRYAMEVYAGAFDESFRTVLYPQVEELQERLGAINDHATAITRFKRWRQTKDRAQLDDEIKALLAEEKKSLRLACKEFTTWWDDTHEMALRRGFVPHLDLKAPDPVALSTEKNGNAVADPSHVPVNPRPVSTSS